MRFKNLIALFLAAVMTSSLALPVFADSPEIAGYAESRELGKDAAADEYSSMGWIVGGFGAGFFLGAVGTGIITAVAARTAPDPETLPPKVDERGYSSGFNQKARSKNTWGALGGGVLGTLLVMTLVMSLSPQ